MEVVVCIGSSCHLRGSRDIVQIFERLISLHSLDGQVELKGSFCMGECTGGVCVSVASGSPSRRAARRISSSVKF